MLIWSAAGPRLLENDTMLQLMSDSRYLEAMMTYTIKMTRDDVKYGADRMRAAKPPRMSINRFMPCACDLQSPALEFWT